MKKTTLVLFLIAVSLVVFTRALRKGEDTLIRAVDHSGDLSGKATADAATSAPEATTPAAAADGTRAIAGDVVESYASAPMAPVMPSMPAKSMLMFEGAPVISSVTEAGPAEGQEKTTKIVETNLKQPYVTLEEIYDTVDGKKVLIDQRAMVANQLMLQMPDGVAEEAFFAALRQAGALELKALDGAVIATFESRPNEPKALDGYLSRVKEILGANVTVEPNYVRKLI